MGSVEIKGLKTALRKLLSPPKEKGVIALGVKELKSGRQFYHHPDLVFPAASIIKIPILIYLGG